ncbi:MAG TPA: ATP-dependent DNA helicase RecG, partial [Candidatus Paceibacterota bacterium]|nr:ATP-dependent DNA helicase RecG [Candidatus Paceibacterota bacterium]
DLSMPVEKLSHVGTRNLPRLKKLGIKTVRDLLWHLPSKYEDYSRIMPIADLQPGEKANVQGTVVKLNVRRIFPKRMTVIDAIVEDDSGAIKAVWFNQPYLANTLPEGTRVSLAGNVKLDKHGLYLASPTYEKIHGDENYYAYNLTHTQGLVPVYPETEGITSKYLRFLIKPLLEQLELEDPLPQDLLERDDLITLQEAIHQIHYPQNIEEADQAKERLSFDDLLLFQIKALLERRKINQLKSPLIKFDQKLISGFIEKLPFELTKDQKVAAWEILKDLERSFPMNRLLEGDVGSGKTVVALIAAIEVAKAGYQAVFMAPTEVLAHQHFHTIEKLTEHIGIEIGLLTSSSAKSRAQEGKKAELKKRIAKGGVKIIVGTHALIQKDVAFDKLALVIIDEQHRFGVQQRAALIKSSSSDLVPHLLSMTATPIPRTLALTIYGDLDISIIKEKPKNRQKIETSIVTPSERSDAYRFIRSEVKNGRQVFVICPRIEIAETTTKADSKTSQIKWQWADMKAVTEEYQKLSEQVFPDLKVAMLHGRMKPKEKQAIMDRFKGGWIDILVSTSVIEVGVDVPNATVMMIENADHFGLAQLHQFRGRIGRGEHRSYCLLLTSSAEKSVNQRLKALESTDDGFALAEKDMSLRGPGSFFGTEQSGLPDLAMAALANVELIKKARTEARTILKADPNLKGHPELKRQLERFQRMTHFE